MQQVVKQLSESLCRRGHEVTVATRFHSGRTSLIINGVKIEEFRISGKEVGGFIAEASELERYRNFLLDSEFDVITNFAAQQWATDIALPILNKIKAVKVFVPTGFSELNNMHFRNYFESMKIWMNEYDANVFLSDDYQDVNFARSNGVKNIFVIPNGASSEEFVVDNNIDIRFILGIPRNHTLILHVGSHTGLKGHKEAIEIFQRSRISNATLLIIGNATQHDGGFKYFCKYLIKSFGNLFVNFSGKRFFPACLISCKWKSILHQFSYHRFRDNKLLLIKDLPRDLVVAAYLEAELFLFASNIECSPLVLFECMASKTPFLTTDVGNAKEIVSWSNSGEILPTLQLKNGLSVANVNSSSVMLEDFIADKTKLIEKGILGFDAFQRDFSWEKISMEYEKLYLSLLRN
jgi:glycosyltransferase involved in cell wall biosynthesis